MVVVNFRKFLSILLTIATVMVPAVSMADQPPKPPNPDLTFSFTGEAGELKPPPEGMYSRPFKVTWGKKDGLDYGTWKLRSFVLGLSDSSSGPYNIIPRDLYPPDGWTTKITSDSMVGYYTITANNENTMLKYGGELKNLSLVVKIPKDKRDDPNAYLNGLFKSFSSFELSN